MEFSGIRFEFWCFIAQNFSKCSCSLMIFFIPYKISVLFDAEF